MHEAGIKLTRLAHRFVDYRSEPFAKRGGGTRRHENASLFGTQWERHIADAVNAESHLGFADVQFEVVTCK